MIAGLSPFESQLVLSPLIIIVVVLIVTVIVTEFDWTIRSWLGEDAPDDPPPAVELHPRRMAHLRELERQLLEQAREQGAIER